MFLTVLTLLAATAAPATEPVSPPPDGPVVLLSTTMGDIKIELDAKKAPISTKNFLSYVESGHYDGTIFHRVIPGFMIQGGGMDSGMGEKATRDPIVNEHSNGLKNKRGTLAMARTNDPNSATAQFFINLKDNGFLDQGPGYAVFGKVVSGMSVVDKIAGVPTTRKAGHEDVPAAAIMIKKAKRVDAQAPAATVPDGKPGVGAKKKPLPGTSKE
jgi:peptidyl-prolyl cis-trans isomerase A (cyclophilin A)